MSAVDLSEVKSHLNIAKDQFDGELEGYLATAEKIIAHRVGPLEPTTVTSVVGSAGTGTLFLPIRPVISLTSVTTSSGAVLSGTATDLTAGLVTYTSGGNFTTGTHTVVYEAGYETLPADLRMAVLELVRHLWDSQRGPTRRPGSAPETAANTAPGAAYLLPFRVEALLAAYESPAVA